MLLKFKSLKCKLLIKNRFKIEITITILFDIIINFNGDINDEILFCVSLFLLSIQDVSAADFVGKSYIAMNRYKRIILETKNTHYI